MCQRLTRLPLKIGIIALLLFSSAYADPGNQYQESFDIVWETINERFYDADFNGVDWLESKKRFRSLVISAKTDDEFYIQINTMLFELGVSHLGVVPSNDVKQLGEASIFGEGTVGIDVRVVGYRR